MRFLHLLQILFRKYFVNLQDISKQIKNVLDIYMKQIL
jgi:hypothetical protein